MSSPMIFWPLSWFCGIVLTGFGSSIPWDHLISGDCHPTLMTLRLTPSSLIKRQTSHHTLCSPFLTVGTSLFHVSFRLLAIHIVQTSLTLLISLLQLRLLVHLAPPADYCDCSPLLARIVSVRPLLLQPSV